MTCFAIILVQTRAKRKESFVLFFSFEVDGPVIFFLNRFEVCFEHESDHVRHGFQYEYDYESTGFLRTEQQWFRRRRDQSEWSKGKTGLFKWWIIDWFRLDRAVTHDCFCRLRWTIRWWLDEHIWLQPSNRDRWNKSDRYQWKSLSNKRVSPSSSIDKLLNSVHRMKCDFWYCVCWLPSG